MNKRLAYGLLWVQVLVLFVGTQMPGAWRAGLEASLHSPFGLSSWAHFVLFAAMAFQVSLQPLRWPWQRVVLTALGLAMLTEAMQFLVIDRHPRWLDVGIDMSGAATGLPFLINGGRRTFKRQIVTWVSRPIVTGHSGLL